MNLITMRDANEWALIYGLDILIFPANDHPLGFSLHR